MMIPRLLLVVLTAASLPAMAAEKVTYDDHVKEFFRSHCSKCHNPEKQKGDLNLMSYNGLMAGSGSGDVVVPGNPRSSVLMQVMTHESEPFMPPKKPRLPREEILIVEQWIEGGLLESSGSKAKKAVRAQGLAMRKTVSAKPDGKAARPEHVLLEPVIRSGRANSVVSLAHSPWAPVMAVGGVSQVLLFDTEHDRLSGVLPFPEGHPATLTFSRNGSLLLAGGGRGGDSGKVVVWDVKSGERVFEVGDEYDTVLAADISVDHAMVALSGPSKLVKIFSTEGGKRLHQIKKHTDWVTALSFSPDGVLLASGDRNGGLHVWEAFSGQRMYSLSGHKGGINALSWRADSDVLVSASQDGTLKLWSMHNGRQIKQFTAHKGGVLSVSFSSDNRLSTTGRNKELKIWDGKGKALKAIKAFKDLPLSVAFTHDGRSVVSGDWLGDVKRWDIESGKEVAVYAANPPSIKERIRVASLAWEDAKADSALAEKAFTDTQSASAAAKDKKDDAQSSLVKRNKELAEAKAEEKVLSTKRIAVRRDLGRAEGKVKQHQGKLPGLKARIAEKEASWLTKDTDRRGKQKALDVHLAEPAPQKPVALEAATPEEQAAWQQSVDGFPGLEKAYRDTSLRLTAQVKQVDREGAGIRRQQDSIKKQLAAAESQLVGARKQSDETRAALKEVERGLAANAQAIRGLEKKLAGLKKTVPALEKSVDAATTRMGESKVTRDQASVTLAAQAVAQRYWKAALVNAEVQRLRQELAPELAVISEIEGEVEEAQTLVDRIAAGLKTERDRLAKKAELLAAATAEIVVADAQIARSNERVVAAEARVKTRQKRVDDVRKDIETATSDLKTEGESDNLKEVLSKYEDVLAALLRERKAAEEQVAATRSDLGSSTQQKKSAVAALTALQSDLAGAPVRMATLESERKEGLQALAGFQAKLEKGRAAIASRQKTVDGRFAEYLKLRP